MRLRFERKAGELTGNQSLETQGWSDQSSGALQKAWGKVKGAAQDVGNAIDSKLGGK